MRVVHTQEKHCTRRVLHMGTFRLSHRHLPSCFQHPQHTRQTLTFTHMYSQLSRTLQHRPKLCKCCLKVPSANTQMVVRMPTHICLTARANRSCSFAVIFVMLLRVTTAAGFAGAAESPTVGVAVGVVPAAAGSSVGFGALGN